MLISKYPSCDDTDKLIGERLKSIDFAFSPMATKGKELSEIKDNFAKDMQNNHERTVLFFYQYCMDSLYKNFIENNKTEMQENIDYIMLTLLSLGYQAGLLGTTEINSAKNPQAEKLFPTLFSRSEFELIAKNLKDLAINFPKDVDETENWLCEHKPIEDEQMGMLMEVAKLISKPKSERAESDREKIAAFAPKISENLSQGSHSLWRIEQYKKLGVPATPVEQLILTLDRIILYSNALHWGGCMNLGNKQGGAESIRYYIPKNN